MLGARERPAITHRAGVITALVTKKGRSDRIAVHLDGAFAFDVSTMVAREAGLERGRALSEAEQESLGERDRPYRARDKALGLLAVRERSRGEVEARLHSAGFDETVTGDTVRWLQGLGYLDDRRFALVYTADRLKSGWGARRIRSELLRKGVERALVEEALADEAAETGGGAGSAAAMRLARKRFAAQFATDPAAARRRLAGFLARRGYDWEAIDQIGTTLLREAREEACDEEDD